MLLSSLPEEYENFRVAIESRDAFPDAEFLKGKLIEEDSRRKSVGKINRGNFLRINKVITRRV